MSPTLGDVLGGRYTLRSRIAGGGMGEVWEAEDSVLRRVVAVKVLRPNAADEPRFAERFRDEARHTAMLSHANIATVYDYGEDHGTAYLVMELVPGTPLSQVIAERAPISPDETRRIIGQAANALAAAHAAGVIHRDVKPANMILTPEGTVKLTDFGIARALDGSSLTRTGEVIGTPNYLSPEQALGRQATAASDLYALGIVAHEMLTGTRPFDSGSPVATALAQVNDEPPPLPRSVPTGLATTVMGCLSKAPEDRPGSAAALAAALGMSPGMASGGLGDTPYPGVVLPPGGVAPTVALGGPVSPTATQPLTTPVVAPAAPTQQMPAPARPVHATPATPSPPSTTYGTPAPPGGTARRNMLWIIVPLVLLLAVAAYFGYRFIASPSPSSTPGTVYVTTYVSATTSTPSQTVSTVTETPTPTTPTKPDRVTVTEKDYLGRPGDEVASELKALGLTVRPLVTKASTEPAGSVLSVSPNGKVAPDSPITITVSEGPPPSPGP